MTGRCRLKRVTRIVIILLVFAGCQGFFAFQVCIVIIKQTGTIKKEFSIHVSDLPYPCWLFLGVSRLCKMSYPVILLAQNLTDVYG